MPVPVLAPDPAWPTVVAADRTAPAFDPTAAAVAELDRQLDAYAALGVTALHGWTPESLRAAVAPLRSALATGLRAAPATGLRADTGPTGHRVPDDDHIGFVLVLDAGTAHANGTAVAMRRGARPGVSVIDEEEMATYRPLPDLALPAAPYLLLDVDTGSEFCGVPPEQALITVRQRGRTPLTVAEGLALVTLRPDMLRPNRCFSLMGSRASNQRVPAVWISERCPKLGWCWDRNPHTWLGAASAGGRAAG